MIQRRFLWSGNQSKQKTHWVNWSAICNPKKMGGLGITNLSLKNRALMNKWIWRFSSETDALWRKLIVEKYGGDFDSLVPSLENHRFFSTVWKISLPLLLALMM